MADLPIGVFDSGIGGLTVLRELVASLPEEDFLYLGDTARLPYGTKTPGTVARYAAQAVGLLVGRGVKLIVVACNTASAAALPALAAAHPDLPVIGVIEPGARAAVAASRSGHVAVLATEATVRGGAYTQAITTLRPDARIDAVAASLFVALAEEGWTSGDIALAVAHRYLDPLFAPAGDAPDTLVLGCTHFPPLAAAIASVAGPAVRIVDSAVTTAEAVIGKLGERQLRRQSSGGRLHFLVTDGEERFMRIGGRFLGRPIDPGQVERVDLR